VNKVIKGKKNENDLNKDNQLSDLRRLNATIKYSQKKSELIHYGVIGQRWGIINRSADSSAKGERLEAVKNRRTISDEELSSMVNRLQMEKKLVELAANDLDPGKEIVRSQSAKLVGIILGSAAGVLGSALMNALLSKKGLKKE